MSGLDSNEVEDADNPDIVPRLTTEENIEAPIKPVLREVNGVEVNGSGEDLDDPDGMAVPQEPDKETVTTIPEEPTSPQMNLLVTNVVSHAIPVEESSPSDMPQESGQEEGVQDFGLNGVQEEVTQPEEIPAENENQPSQDNPTCVQDLDSQSDTQKESSDSVEPPKATETVLDISSEAETETNPVVNESEVAQTEDKESIEHEHEMGTEPLSLQPEDSVETEPSSSEVSESVLDLDSHGGGVGELTITSVGTFHGDITDEGAIEAMETDHNDDAILCSSSAQSVEKETESMEVSESEDRLLKQDEGTMSEDVEEMDEDNLLREKEPEKEEEASEVKDQEVVEEKSGESSQDVVVNEESLGKDVTDIALTQEDETEAGEGNNDNDTSEVTKTENLDNSTESSAVETVVESQTPVETSVENEKVLEAEKGTEVETPVEKNKDIEEKTSAEDVSGEATRDTDESKGEKSSPPVDEDIVMIDDKEDVKKPKEEEKEEDDDSDDIAIVGVSPATKKQPSVSSGSGLQISSVSGGTDISDVLNKDKQQKTEAPRQPSKSEVNKETKKSPASTPAKPPSKVQTCIVCNKVGKCKYNIVRNGDVKHLCDDTCFQKFRSNPTQYLRASNTANSSNAAPKQTRTEPKKPPTTNSGQEQFKTCSVCQLMNIKTSKPFLNWQGMDFCGEDCLGKFQASLNAACTNCANMVTATAKGKFCLRYGNIVKQFCCNNCYIEFKKRQKLCECCQKDISKSVDAFVAPVGKEGTFKDFCSQSCLQKYEDKTNCDVEIVGVERAQKSKTLPKGEFPCSVCKKHSTVKHEILLEGKTHQLCSDPCLSAFQYANKLTLSSCDNCGTYCYSDGAPQFIQFEGQQKRFCSFVCVNKFKSEKKKIVACAWCNSKKGNFDMIERVDANNKYQLFCSLNCLSLYRVNLQATSNQAVVCDHCRKFVPAQYHLTMSDASVRNFCSYQCVMAFQSQFAASANKTTPPVNQSQQPTVKPPQQPVKQPPQHVKQQPQKPVQQVKNAPVTRNATRAPPSKQPPASKQLSQRAGQAPGSSPVISNIVSLAPKASQQGGLKSVSTAPPANQVQTKTSQVQIQQQIVIQPSYPKSMKNKSVMCKPFLQTKATSCKPHTQTLGIQTEKVEPEKVIIPVPIPFYVPVPMSMYTQPTPVPFPVPVPIPIPCFIPTTKKSADGILKHIKEIREKIPNDPLEAELLMMAEAVAGVGNESDSDSEKEAEPESKKKTNCKSPTPTPHSTGPDAKETTTTTTASTAKAESNGDLGEDMLQMALRMASEMSEPVMDLENSIEPVPVNTEPPPPPPAKPPPEESTTQDEDDEVYIPRETRSGRASTKRASRGGGNKRRHKRQKVNHHQPSEPPMEESTPEPSEPEVPEPAPDANMHLKFTYGVNAWKHWVIQKNAQLEKVSKQGSGKLKMFKTDMMGCTADELNYSLCLFVKEVRKPNGEEYAPDSIFYLCLGIQQYLFENGRIDNIFTDMYYEKFTECLNELLIPYQPKVNSAGQLVCRIEEEHLWESKQLGAHSPHVLLNTLVYFNTKYFMLHSAEDHLKLSFTHIMKHWKKSPPGKGNSAGRSVFLRYYCPTPLKNSNDSQKSKKKEELPIYEQAENVDNPLRCPVKLYEFYLSKCPESIKNRSDAFYLVPERSCVPDSPVWYSTQNLSTEAMNKMLHRIRLVREIQEAKYHTQPVYATM